MNAPHALGQPRLAKLTVKDFLTLSEAGAFDDYARTELIAGEIWIVNALYSRHARIHTIMIRRLGDACETIGDGVEAWIDASVAVDDGSMPQPDILVVRTPIAQGPIPLDSLLIAVEVADTSLDHDLGVKAALYAAAGVAEYWVVDIEKRVIHQLWNPVGDAFASGSIIAFGTPITAETVGRLEIATTAL